MRFVRYRTAERGFGLRLNKYGSKTIGAALLLGWHAYSLVWRKP
jgi:hypothetical protein